MITLKALIPRGPMLLRHYFDRDVVSAIAVRLSGTITSLFSAILIVNFLNLEAQGYWYTFGSILGIAGMAEMGAGQILMRFVAYEQKQLSGDSRVRAEARLHDLFIFSIYWGGAICIIVSLLSFPVGLWWLGVAPAQGTISWSQPWFLACLSCVPMLGLAFLNSYFEGWQRVAEANLRRALVAWLILGVTALCFSLELSLWGYGLGRTVGSLGGIAILLYMHRDIIKRLDLSRGRRMQFDWRREFLPLQGRYALTWATGIFVNGLYAPVIFRYVDAEAAGRFGMSLSAVNVLSGVASAWVGARQAKMAALAGNGDHGQLRLLLRQVVRVSLFAFAIGAIALALIMAQPPGFAEKYTMRMLPAFDVVLLTAAAFLWLLINIFTTYVRSFNTEPFVKLAWAHAVFTVVLLVPAVLCLGVTGAVIISLVGNAGSAYVCFRILRKTLDSIQ